jgi:hypothetical protein
LQVFGAAGGFFGADDVAEVGDHDDDVSDADSVGGWGQLGVAGGESGGVEGDMELAVVADQVPDLGCGQGGGVVAGGQSFGCGFGAYPGVQLGKRARAGSGFRRWRRA